MLAGCLGLSVQREEGSPSQGWEGTLVVVVATAAVPMAVPGSRLCTSACSIVASTQRGWADRNFQGK